VTTDVTTPVTTDVAAPLTTDIAASVTSTISSSRIVTGWADAKPFPEPAWPSRTVQFWPTDVVARDPSAEEIARELFLAMQKHPTCAGRWVLAKSIELVVYPMVCEDLGWPMRPWMGKKGVAAYLAKLCPEAPRYMRAEICGEARSMIHYFIPDAPQNVVPLRRG
jgi:hypothetical protein